MKNMATELGIILIGYFTLVPAIQVRPLQGCSLGEHGASCCFPSCAGHTPSTLPPSPMRWAFCWQDGCHRAQGGPGVAGSGGGLSEPRLGHGIELPAWQPLPLTLSLPLAACLSFSQVAGGGLVGAAEAGCPLCSPVRPRFPVLRQNTVGPLNWALPAFPGPSPDPPLQPLNTWLAPWEGHRPLPRALAQPWGCEQRWGWTHTESEAQTLAAGSGTSCVKGVKSHPLPVLPPQHAGLLRFGG